MAQQHHDRQHKDLLGPCGSDDADARGEHAYPGDVPRRPGELNGMGRQPGHYAAGAEGTADIGEPDAGRRARAGR